VYTKYAQAADWAMSILFSKNKGIVTIPDAKFYWRYSGDNISSTAHKIKSKTMEGHLQFLKWISIHFQYLKNGNSPVSYEMMMSAAAENFTKIIINHYKGYSINNTLRLANFLHEVFHFSYFRAFKILLYIKKQTNNRVYRVYHLVKKGVDVFRFDRKISAGKFF
jgi:hypothetical protein